MKQCAFSFRGTHSLFLGRLPTCTPVVFYHSQFQVVPPVYTVLQLCFESEFLYTAQIMIAHQDICPLQLTHNFNIKQASTLV